jgi:hypothetical protein
MSFGISPIVYYVFQRGKRKTQSTSNKICNKHSWSLAFPLVLQDICRDSRKITKNGDNRTLESDILTNSDDFYWTMFTTGFIKIRKNPNLLSPPCFSRLESTMKRVFWKDAQYPLKSIMINLQSIKIKSLTTTLDSINSKLNHTCGIRWGIMEADEGLLISLRS